MNNNNDNNINPSGLINPNVEPLNINPTPITPEMTTEAQGTQAPIGLEPTPTEISQESVNAGFSTTDAQKVESISEVPAVPIVHVDTEETVATEQTSAPVPVVETIVQPATEVTPVVAEEQANVISQSEATSVADQSGDVPLAMAEENSTAKKKKKQPKEKGEGPSVGGIVSMVLIFSLLIGAILGLPYLTEYLEEKKTEENGNSTSSSSSSSTEEEKPNISDDTPIYHTIGEGVTFTQSGLVFSNLGVQNENGGYYIKFDVQNTNISNITFESRNYFLELYTEENTFVERIKLEGNLITNTTHNLSFAITIDSFLNATKILLVEKKVSDYPEITLSTDLNQNGVLTCVNGRSTVIYTFAENKLQSINDAYYYETLYPEDSEYQNLSTKYQNLKVNYDTIDGVSAGWATTTTSFSFTATIDLSTANVSTLNNKNYYALNTEAKIVKFEMEAMRYACS